jgi:hypothetical protein
MHYETFANSPSAKARLHRDELGGDWMRGGNAITWKKSHPRRVLTTMKNLHAPQITRDFVHYYSTSLDSSSSLAFIDSVRRSLA